MSFASQARDHIDVLMKHLAPGLPKKSALPRVAEHLKLNVRRVRAFWNLEARAVLAHELAALKAARDRAADRALMQELHRYANRLESYAAHLAVEDSEGHREDIDRNRRRARFIRDFLDHEGA